MSHTTTPPPDGPRHGLPEWQPGDPGIRFDPRIGHTPPQPPKPAKRRWPLIAGGLLALLGLGSCLAGGATDQAAAPDAVPAPTVTVTTAPAASTTASVSSQPSVSAAEPTTQEPTTAAPKPKPAAPALTVSQENAVDAAVSYLEAGAFSKKGLIDQLEYEEFSGSDAKFAISYLEKQDAVDWNEQAAAVAESYMESGSFSRGSLIQQLKFEGFTQGQAEYGAKRVGL